MSFIEKLVSNSKEDTEHGFLFILAHEEIFSTLTAQIYPGQIPKAHNLAIYFHYWVRNIKVTEKQSIKQTNKTHYLLSEVRNKLMIHVMVDTHLSYRKYTSGYQNLLKSLS